MPHDAGRRSDAPQPDERTSTEGAGLLPPGWLLLFGATAVFALVFWFVYRTAGRRPDPTAADSANEGELLSARIRALSRDPEAVAAGAEVFRRTCAACHGPRGEGGIGPNLTDVHWIHPSDPETIYRSVMDGYVEKGMPAWGPIVGSEQALRVSAYVVTLKGRNLPGRAPQGDRVE